MGSILLMTFPPASGSHMALQGTVTDAVLTKF